MTTIGGRDFAIELKKISQSNLNTEQKQHFLKSVENRFKDGPEVNNDNKIAFVNEIKREYFKVGGNVNDLNSLEELIDSKKVREDFKNSFLKALHTLFVLGRMVR